MKDVLKVQNLQKRFGKVQALSEKLELAQNVSELLGNKIITKNSEGKYGIRYSDGVKKYYYTSTKEMYDNNESITKQKAKLMKVTNEIYLEFIKEVVLGLDKMNFKKYVKDNSQLKAYINKNSKLTTEGAKKIYTSLGATCK